MLTPEYILEMTEGAEEIAQKLRQDMLNNIARRIVARIGDGEEALLSASDRWQVQVLQESGYLLEDIQKDIASKTKVEQNEIKSAFERSAIKSMEYNNEVYAAAGIEPIIVRESPYILQILDDSYKATMGEWKNIVRTSARESQKVFIRECDRALINVQSGGMSYAQAVGTAIDNIIKDGATIKYHDALGNVTKSDTVETATLRAVRTAIVQSTARVTLQSIKDTGWDIVVTSAHMGARPTHEVWQGRFFSLGGNARDRFPNFYQETRYGEVDGICGINCRHSFGVGDGVNNPYDHIDSDENERVYEIQQKQRSYERRLRKLAYEKNTYKTAYEAFPKEHSEQAEFVKQKYEDKRKKYDALMDEYLLYCKANKLKPLYERIRIARQDNYGKRKKAV